MNIESGARKTIHRLRTNCDGWDPGSKRWDVPERALWWRVIEDAWMSIARVAAAKIKGVKIHDAEYEREWLINGDSDGVYEAVGLEPSYVRDIFNRWEMYNEAFGGSSGGGAFQSEERA